MSNSVSKSGFTLRRPGGWLAEFDRITGKTTEYDTTTCCHCNSMVVVRPGVRLGFCRKCDHLTCSNPNCHEHYSFSQKLDDYEAGKLETLA